MWYQYNIEPIPGWKMFRTASMLWESYNMKHRNGKTQRSKQEESKFPGSNRKDPINQVFRSRATTVLDMPQVGVVRASSIFLNCSRSLTDE